MRGQARLWTIATAFLMVLSVVALTPAQPAHANGGRPVVYLTFDDGPDNQGNWASPETVEGF